MHEPVVILLDPLRWMSTGLIYDMAQMMECVACNGCDEVNKLCFIAFGVRGRPCADERGHLYYPWVSNIDINSVCAKQIGIKDVSYDDAWTCCYRTWSSSLSVDRIDLWQIWFMTWLRWWNALPPVYPAGTVVRRSITSCPVQRIPILDTTRFIFQGLRKTTFRRGHV